MVVRLRAMWASRERGATAVEYALMVALIAIAVIGAGMGGLTAAATLRQAGFAVHVYEQAGRFARIGAGIQMMPNAMKVLRRLGIEDRLRRVAFQPFSHLNRESANLTPPNTFQLSTTKLWLNR